jgi:hypothetical protein
MHENKLNRQLLKDRPPPEPAKGINGVLYCAFRAFFVQISRYLWRALPVGGSRVRDTHEHGSRFRALNY